MKPGEVTAALPSTREEAQGRADRIRAFQSERRTLESEGVLSLTAEQASRLEAHHEALLDRLARSYDVDRTEGQKRLSTAMRIASLLGAIALGAAGYFFFFRFWGGMGATAQVSVLVAGPLLALLGMELAARREKTLYVTLLVGVLFAVFFVIDLSVLAAISNVPLPPGALVAWALTCGILAYAFGLRLLLVAAILFAMGFVGTFTGPVDLCVWDAFGRRPENFLLLGAALYATPLVVPHRRMVSFPAAYRALGLVCVFVPILILACAGHASYLRQGAAKVEAAYQVLGFLLAALAIWAGTRRGESETTNLGSAFFVVLLYVKFFQWWWDWMPKWAFFLVLGLVAVVLLAVMRRFHAMKRGAGA